MYITTTARSGTVRKNMDTAGRILFPSSSWFIPYCFYDSDSRFVKCTLQMQRYSMCSMLETSVLCRDF